MFDFLGDVAKAAAAVVTVPVAIVADVVTFGGILTEKDEPYTAKAASHLMDNIENITKPRE